MVSSNYSGLEDRIASLFKVTSIVTEEIGSLKKGGMKRSDNTSQLLVESSPMFLLDRYYGFMFPILKKTLPCDQFLRSPQGMERVFFGKSTQIVEDLPLVIEIVNFVPQRWS